MRKRITVFTVALLAIATLSHADLSVVGADGFREYDPAQFPAARKISYKLMKNRCTKCHTLDRVVQAIQTGIAPVSWRPFDQDSAKSYGEKVMRRANREMTREEVRDIVDLLQWLISQENGKYLEKLDN